MKLPTISLFGFRLYSGSRQTVLSALSDTSIHQVRTISYLNAHAVVLASTPGAFRDAIHDVDVLVADGRSLSWTAAVAGTPINEVIAGSELFADLLHLAADRGWRVCLVGYDPELLARTRIRCHDRNPGAQFVEPYIFPSPFPDDARSNDHLAEHLRQCGVEVVFLGLGSPYQELLTQALRQVQGLRLIMCTGASFSYYTGQLNRAPLWIGRLGLEWFWRFVHEPRRLWRRYSIGLFRYFRLAFREILVRRFH